MKKIETIAVIPFNDSIFTNQSSSIILMYTNIYLFYSLTKEKLLPTALSQHRAAGPSCHHFAHAH